jgi:hypothetical protein
VREKWAFVHAIVYLAGSNLAGGGNSSGAFASILTISRAWRANALHAQRCARSKGFSLPEGDECLENVIEAIHLATQL